MTSVVKPVRIFLAEDNAPDILLIREALHANGIAHELYFCSNGEEAIRTLSAEDPATRPHLIVLDLNLPRIGGFEVLRWIRSRSYFSDIPIAILTSSQSREDRALAAELGADRFLSKPPTLNDFLNVVGSGLVDLLRRGRQSRPAGRSACRAKGTERRASIPSVTARNCWLLPAGGLALNVPAKHRVCWFADKEG